MKIKVLAVTGIRSEYDILYPVLKEINEDERFQLELVVSGAHLSNEHGYTLELIEKDGFEIVDCIDSLFTTQRLTQRSKAVGALVSGLSQTVERVVPNFLLVVGDREESIATAIVGNYMDVLVAHIGGGDPVWGNADDPIRMAVSKLAHIHFTTTQEYADNLVLLGEDDWRIKFCGTPGLDNIANEPKFEEKEIQKRLNLPELPMIVVLKHPLSSEKLSTYEQMKVTLESISEFCEVNNYQAVVIQPNSDPGSNEILLAINECTSEYVHFTHTLPRSTFVNLMRHAKVLVGNSSMGILEAPMHKLPVVNVGSRQQGRLNAGNVEFVKHDKQEIIKAIEQGALNSEYRNHVANLSNPYGEGKAGKLIKDALLSIEPSQYQSWHIKEKLVSRGEGK